MLRKAGHIGSAGAAANVDDLSGVSIGYERQIPVTAPVGRCSKSPTDPLRQRRDRYSTGNSVHPMPTLADSFSDRTEGHVLGEANTKASNGRMNPESLPTQSGSTIATPSGSFYPGYPYLENALTLKEVEMPQAFDLSIVDLVRAGGPWMREMGTMHEIESQLSAMDGQREYLVSRRQRPHDALRAVATRKARRLRRLAARLQGLTSIPIPEFRAAVGCMRPMPAMSLLVRARSHRAAVATSPKNTSCMFMTHNLRSIPEFRKAEKWN